MLESNITAPSSADEVTKEWLKEVLSSSFPHATFTSLEGKRNERLKGAPLTLLHGDFHLDNIVFEKLTEPVFLDWSHPLIGGPAYNLVTLLFYMTPLKYFGKVIDCYLGEFNELAKSKLNRTRLEKQLGGEFLRSFAIATCGVPVGNRNQSVAFIFSMPVSGS